MKTILLLILLGIFPYSVFGWVLSTDKDKMTDESWHYLSIRSENNVWIKKKAELTITHNCTKDIMRIYLTHPYLIGNGPVDIRLDNENKTTEYASASQSKKILFIGDESINNLGSTSDNNPKNLAKKWKSHKKLLIQYETINRAKEVAKFNISGLSSKLENLCK